MGNKIRFQRMVRKAHRYLGVILGIQFLFWTLGGLYFSWTNIDQIRGTDIRAADKHLPIPLQSASLSDLLDKLRYQQPGIIFHHIQLTAVLGKVFYEIHVHTPDPKVLLFDAQTLEPKPPVDEQEAIAIAKDGLKNPSEALSVEYLTQATGGHEYREKPLPAYAVTFGAPNNTTVYVAAESGTIQSFRNNSWRVFDFLWMLHTMDYQSRDDLNNWLLRAFSIFGLVTILSGFALYFLTSRRWF